MSLHHLSTNELLEIPFFNCSVSAGFPSPADDYIHRGLDLNQYLIKHPSSTFFFRMKSDAMTGAGIFAGSLLIVDRSLEAQNNKIIVAQYEGELVVRRYSSKDKMINLFSENQKYPNITVTEDSSFLLWGIVTNVIYQL